jgi:hypothetical protein
MITEIINMPPYTMINENIDQILHFIELKHVIEYDWLAENIHQVEDADYQRRYKIIFRLYGAGLSQHYCQEYFKCLHMGINVMAPQLNTLINHLYQIPVRQNIHKLQFSFCTKLCHMLNRSLPIYDSNIKDFYQIKTPGYNLIIHERIKQFIEIYQYINNEYQRVLDNGLLKESIKAFRQFFNPRYFTDIKVIDSLIWASSHRKKRNKGIW